MIATLPRPVQHTGESEWSAMVDELTRRRFVGGLGAAATLLAAGCGADHQPDGRSATAAAGFPRTIEHEFGSTEVAASPERLVVAGFTDIDVTLALGITPVGYNDWFGTGEIGPWASDLVDGPAPEAFELVDGIPLEKVLALEPDLVIATDALSKKEYDALSSAVPTVGPIDGQFWGTPWRDHVRRTAKILAREDTGEDLVTGLEDHYATTKAQHPEFADVTVSYAWPSEAGMALYVGQDDTRVQVLSELGFAATEHVLQLREDNPDEFYVDLSAENIRMLEADVLMMQIYGEKQRAVAESNPLFASLDVVKRGDVIWNRSDVSDALAFGTVLSIPYVIDTLVPTILRTLDDGRSD